MRTPAPRSGGGGSGRAAELEPACLYEDAALRWRDFRERIGPAIVSAVNFARVISESDTFYGDKLDTLKSLRKSAEQLALLDQETSDRSDVCSEVRCRILREANNGEPADSDVELYKAELAKREQLRPAVEHSDAGRYLKDIDTTIKSISSDGDDLFVAGGRAVASRCPITGKDLVDPVMNKSCGHAYSTSGIIGYLWQSAGRKSSAPAKLANVPDHISVACPNAGCSALVTKSSLARDFMTERSQRRALLDSATQREPAGDDVDDVDDLVD